MPKQSLVGHIQRNHHKEKLIDDLAKMVDENLMPLHQLTRFVACQYCNQSVLKSNLAKHVAKNHALGMIRLDKLNDDDFNKLIDEKGIYAKDGNLFRK